MREIFETGNLGNPIIDTRSYTKATKISLTAESTEIAELLCLCGAESHIGAQRDASFGQRNITRSYTKYTLIFYCLILFQRKGNHKSKNLSIWIF